MNKYCIGNPWCLISDMHPEEKMLFIQRLLDKEFENDDE